jgi:hypothetical protein
MPPGVGKDSLSQSSRRAEHTALWKTYEPKNLAPPSDSQVQMKEIMFLVQPPREYMNVDDFVAYTTQIEAILEESIPVQLT